MLKGVKVQDRAGAQLHLSPTSLALSLQCLRGSHMFVGPCYPEQSGQWELVIAWAGWEEPGVPNHGAWELHVRQRQLWKVVRGL
jgi:hypothetical protein